MLRILRCVIRIKGPTNHMGTRQLSTKHGRFLNALVQARSQQTVDRQLHAILR